MRRVQLPLQKRQVRGKKRVLRRDRQLRRRDGRAESLPAEYVRGVPSGHGPGEIVRRPLGLSRQNGRGLRRVSGRILQQNERLSVSIVSRRRAYALGKHVREEERETSRSTCPLPSRSGF